MPNLLNIWTPASNTGCRQHTCASIATTLCSTCAKQQVCMLFCSQAPQALQWPSQWHDGNVGCWFVGVLCGGLLSGVAEEEQMRSVFPGSILNPEPSANGSCHPHQRLCWPSSGLGTRSAGHADVGIKPTMYRKPHKLCITRQAVASAMECHKNSCKHQTCTASVHNRCGTLTSPCAGLPVVEARGQQAVGWEEYQQPIRHDTRKVGDGVAQVIPVPGHRGKVYMQCTVCV
jgi:hypothetical protein